jgi:hypothetical protein
MRLLGFSGGATIGSVAALGRVDKVAYPQPDRDEMNETVEGLGEFVIAGCKASRVLETIEATFDAISQSVNRFVDLDLNTPIFLRGNDRRAAALLDIGANGIRVVTAIGEQHFGIGRCFLHQRLVAFDVVRFAGRERGSDRETLRVRSEVYLGREATARTAKSVFLNPPFPPAAW